MTALSSNTSISSKPWGKSSLPKRILAIRLQAMGDLVITLPYLQHLRNTLPKDTRLDLLTREEVEAIPEHLDLFDDVISIGGGRNGKKQLLHLLLLMPRLLRKRYDVVIDLQNTKLSKIARKTLRPQAWSEFERFAPLPAGECTRLAIEAINIGSCKANPGFKFHVSEKQLDQLLMNHGWDGYSRLVVLNPAGAFETRNWPLDYYVEFATTWLQHFPDTQFLTLGVDFIATKANYLKAKLGSKLINLVNKTSPVEAFALIQKMHFVLSEDSGLMHMSWVSGIPTLAIFGSTRCDRATPLGKHTFLLGSSDLPCGNCMLEQCSYGDNHCLTRFAPSFVFEKAMALLEHVNIKNPMHA